MAAGANGHEARIPLRAFVVVATHIAAVLLLAVWTLGQALPHQGDAAPGTAGAPATTGADPAADPGRSALADTAGRRGSEISTPTGVRMPSVAIDTGTVPVGKEEDGSLEVPDDPHVSGWWTGGVAPGEPGAAVIVGHVDSREGPGAFFRLGDLQPGERVTVDREDGSSVDFHVDRVERHPKDDFPTAAVYGQTEQPTLRLITCSGAFDRQERSYEDNTIVFLDPAEPAAREVADRASARPAPQSSEAEPVGSASPVGSPSPGGQPGRAVPLTAAMLSLAGSLGGLVRQRQVAR